jgi:hypothetical protein
MDNLDVSFLLCIGDRYTELQVEPVGCIDGIVHALRLMHTQAVSMSSKKAWLVL